jgi:hypothetical protein
MGLKSRLVSQNSNLRLLKFGKDLQNGGNSNQPYVTTPLPGVEEPLSPNSPDYILRQGVLSRIKDDETRFFKYFTSTKGLAFSTKQNILSLTSVRTQASQGPVNQGVYLPTSTAAQLAANPFGGHLNFLGADPTGLLGGIRKYGDLVNPPLGIGSIADPDNNRLISLSKDLDFIGGKSQPISSNSRLSKALQSARTFLSNGKTLLYSYNGGPGASEGIGKTNIYRYSFSQTKKPSNFEGFGGKQHSIEDLINQWVSPLGVTDYYNATGLQFLGESGLVLGTKTYNIQGDKDILKSSNTEVWNSKTIASESSFTYIGEIREDFRKKLRNQSQSPSYVGDKAWDIRTNAGDPGYVGNNRTDYTKGNFEPVDKINALPLYQSNKVKNTNDAPVNDLIKFRIASVNNDDPNLSVYMHFRAFIDSFSDSYGTQWSGERYPGRGEEFFRYGGFTRGISLSFTVAAQSKQELIPMYKKLNFLASNTMNDYSPSGYMRAPFIKLTIGGYLYEQFGFLKSINYGWEMAAPFEIGINTEGKYDSSVKELPHVIRVTGFEFQPIYDFLPQKQTNIYNGASTKEIGEVTQYGKERYIALANGDSDSGEGDSNYGAAFIPQTLNPNDISSTFQQTLDNGGQLNLPETNLKSSLTKSPSFDLNSNTNLDIPETNLQTLPGQIKPSSTFLRNSNPTIRGGSLTNLFQ